MRSWRSWSLGWSLPADFLSQLAGGYSSPSTQISFKPRKSPVYHFTPRHSPHTRVSPYSKGSIPIMIPLSHTGVCYNYLVKSYPSLDSALTIHFIIPLFSPVMPLARRHQVPWVFKVYGPIGCHLAKPSSSSCNKNLWVWWCTARLGFQFQSRRLVSNIYIAVTLVVLQAVSTSALERLQFYKYCHCPMEGIRGLESVLASRNCAHLPWLNI